MYIYEVLIFYYPDVKFDGDLFLSPERIMGLDYSHPSDIWSLGITLLEWLDIYLPVCYGTNSNMLMTVLLADIHILTRACISS